MTGHSGGPNPHDPGDGGRHGESHTDRGDRDHHSIYRDGSHISWDSDRDGDYIHGSGHTRDHDPGRNTPWDR